MRTAILTFAFVMGMAAVVFAIPLTPSAGPSCCSGPWMPSLLRSRLSAVGIDMTKTATRCEAL